MARTKKRKVKLRRMSIDFPNDDGTVDEWVYDLTVKHPAMHPVKITYNISRRK